MMDLRYHVVSLIGVFLALAAGLAIGAALTGSDEQASRFANLQKQYTGLREQDDRVNAENRALKQQLEVWNRVGRELRIAAIRDRLAGQRVGAIVCGAKELPAYWADLRSTLEVAGAQEAPTLFVPDDLKPLEPALRERLAATWGSSGETADAPRDTFYWLLRGMGAMGTGQRVQDLAGMAGVRADGATNEPVRRWLVLIAPPTSERAARAPRGTLPEFALADAARSLRDLNIRLVFGEEQSAEHSLVGQLAPRGVPTVDNIDTVVGQTAAVLALTAGGGAYGVKPGASAPLPPVTP